MKSIYLITISKDQNSLVLCQFDLLFHCFSMSMIFLLSLLIQKKNIYIVSIYERVLPLFCSKWKRRTEWHSRSKTLCNVYLIERYGLNILSIYLVEIIYFTPKKKIDDKIIRLNTRQISMYTGTLKFWIAVLLIRVFRDVQFRS